jgi:hypothetical protein
VPVPDRIHSNLAVVLQLLSGSRVLVALGIRRCVHSLSKSTAQCAQMPVAPNKLIRNTDQNWHVA